MILAILPMILALYFDFCIDSSDCAECPELSTYVQSVVLQTSRLGWSECADISGECPGFKSCVSVLILIILSRLKWMCWYQWLMPWIQILRYCRFLMILSIDWSECAAVCAECQILWYCRYINILSIDWSECAAVCAECPGLRWSDPGSPHHKIHQVNLSVEK